MASALCSLPLRQSVIDFRTLSQHLEVYVGKGGYLGGSTVIYPGGRWSSDPLNFPDRANSHKAAPSRPKKAGPRKNGLTDEAKALAVVFEAQRLSYLHSIVDAFIRRASSFPAAPKKARNVLAAQVAKAGGEMSWARMQPEFLKLAEKKRKRHEKKTLMAVANGTPGAAAKNAVLSGAGAHMRAEYHALLAKKAKLEQDLKETNRKLLEIKGHFDRIGAKV
ncbi:hypothetical protein [Ensifer adhaerens]|uniref:hypothetical protein n=1 Tax=Ensifer adhaerens TaxID=106592 RepID=UPI00128FC66F|nr:hypothetical protein [Ensifer adhaerens]